MYLRCVASFPCHSTILFQLRLEPATENSTTIQASQINNNKHINRLISQKIQK